MEIVLVSFISIAGPEYGTTEAAWKAVLNEADRRSEAHIRVRDNLHNEVIIKKRRAVLQLAAI